MNFVPLVKCTMEMGSLRAKPNYSYIFEFSVSLMYYKHIWDVIFWVRFDSVLVCRELIEKWVDNPSRISYFSEWHASNLETRTKPTATSELWVLGVHLHPSPLFCNQEKGSKLTINFAAFHCSKLPAPTDFCTWLVLGPAHLGRKEIKSVKKN